MADWVHCNCCFNEPGNGLKFFLTNCGHLYCQECESKATKPCKICGANCVTILLSNKMKPDVEMFFLDPAELFKQFQKKLLKVMDFQHGHRQRLTGFRRDKADKLKAQETLLCKAQKVINNNLAMEREMIILREENALLKKMVESSGGRYVSPSRRSMHNVSPRSSRNSSHSGSPYGYGTVVMQQASSASTPNMMTPTQNNTHTSMNSYLAGCTPMKSGRITIRPSPTQLTQSREASGSAPGLLNKFTSSQCTPISSPMNVSPSSGGTGGGGLYPIRRSSNTTSFHTPTDSSQSAHSTPNAIDRRLASVAMKQK